MNRGSKLLATILLSAVMLCANAAQAMEIRQFDKMANQDQSDYIGDLIVGAEKVLTDEGRSDLAAQVEHLFTTKNPGDADVIGAVEFERNLALARVADAKRAEKDPGAPRVEVEDAMAITLQKNGIELPDSFFTVASNFHPKLPPKPPMVTPNPDGTFTVQKEPPNGNSKDAKAKEGLVIPPQVVVPFVRLPEKKQSPTPQQKNQ
jgi:hypothetical protein